MGLSPPMRDVCWWEQKVPAQLYSGLSLATLTPLGAFPSTTPTRCKITASAITDHTDCTGHLFIGSEDIEFKQAATKVSTTNLIAVPIITSTGLDCQLQITWIDSSGAPINTITNVPVKIRWEDYSKGVQTSEGNWSSVQGSRAYTKNMTLKPLDKIKFDRFHHTDPTAGIEYTIIDIAENGMELSGNTISRMLIF